MPEKIERSTTKMLHKYRKSFCLRERIMAKEVLFNQDYNKIVTDNLEIFKYEYPDIGDKNWEDFKNKPNCKCRGEIFKSFKDDINKFNAIMSKLTGEDIEMLFPGPLEETLVKEFDDLKSMEEFLNDLRKKGKMIRQANPSPNGKGGFVLICM